MVDLTSVIGKHGKKFRKSLSRFQFAVMILHFQGSDTEMKAVSDVEAVRRRVSLFGFFDELYQQAPIAIVK